jgi:transglutaminase-like putative cysteine protease
MNRSSSWVLLTLILAALPSFIRLPWWVAAVAVVGGAWHYAGKCRRGWYGRGLNLMLLAGAIGGVWYSFESWFSGEAVLSFFITVVFLKWSEAKTRRDFLLLIFAAVILAAVGALYFESLLNLAHMLVVIFALTLSLIAIHMEGARPVFLLRRAGLLVVLGLPLMLLLFLTFPRIPGPLWDIGLAFGLPVKALMDRGAGDHGKSTVLEPGGIQRAQQNNDNVLVAEFEGAVPFKSRMYWRGPVFWDYDGENWSLPDGWDDRNRLMKTAIRSKAQLDRLIHTKDTPVRYTLRVMPNGGRWLYGLDAPAAAAPESFISEDLQLLSIRRIDDQEPKLQMLAYLDYSAGNGLTPEQRSRALAWPEGSNARLRALGRQLAQEHHSAEEIIHAVYTRLASSGFRFDPAHVIEPGPDLLDRFFFDEKRGGVEYLAGAAAMLMRAAGVPSRLVNGYRGGTIIALTNFVIVKRTDTHAWVEAWQDGKGWGRVEPLDIIAPPPEEKSAAGKPKETPQSATVVEMKPAGQSEQQPTEQPRQDQPAAKAKTPAARPDAGWSLPDWASVFTRMQKWVINYNPDRQMELLKGVGLQQSNWVDLLIGGVSGVGGLLAVYGLVAWVRGRRAVDRVGRSWAQFCRRMAREGVVRSDQECPRDYLARICRERPDLTSAAEDVVGRYIDIRYGGGPDPEAVRLFRRQIQRFLSMT